jgi:hypothetical protein
MAIRFCKENNQFKVFRKMRTTHFFLSRTIQILDRLLCMRFVEVRQEEFPRVFPLFSRNLIFYHHQPLYKKIETLYFSIHAQYHVMYVFTTSYTSIWTRGSSGSTVSDYGLDDRGSIPDRDRGFFF